MTRVRLLIASTAVTLSLLGLQAPPAGAAPAQQTTLAGRNVLCLGSLGIFPMGICIPALFQ